MRAALLPDWEMLSSPAFLLTHFVVALICALFCLVGIWAATSKRHWLIRTAAVLVPLVLLVPVQAYEPLLFFAVVNLLLFLGWSIVGWWSKKNWGNAFHGAPSGSAGASPSRTLSLIQFRLLDLLLAVAIFGVVLWVANQIVAHGVVMGRWWKLPIAALIAALIASISVVLLDVRRRWATLLLLVGLIAGGAAVDFWLLGEWMYLELANYRNFAVYCFDYALLALACLLITVLARAWRVVSDRRAEPESAAVSPTAVPGPARRSGPTVVFRGIGLVGGLASAALLAWIYWQMLDFSHALPPNPTGPNSLPRVMQLGAGLQWTKANASQAQPIYDELLVRLAEPGYVPIDYRAAQREWLAYTPVDIQLARQIARDLKAEGERLQAASKSDEAADYLLAIVQLGLMLQRDGSAAEWSVGIALESVGHDELVKYRGGIGPARGAALADQLGRLEAAALPIDQVRDRCHQFALISEGWRYRFELLLQQDLWQGTNPWFSKQLTSAWLRRQTIARLLLTDLALRRFHDDRGTWPDRLEQLVPTYLPAVPLDPYSDRPLIYHPNESGFLLYSVGIDRLDNGGKFTSRGTYHNAASSKTEGWDFDLDTLIRP